MRKLLTIILLALVLTPAWAQESKDVVIRRTDAQSRQVRLAGTLTLPQGRAPRSGWPAMVLVTGSGSQNRDEELAGHRPFAVIADFMARHGVATLRCDDRGVGGSSGVFPDVGPGDLADDIIAQIDFLKKQKKVDNHKIGVLGHSEGGLLALMASRNTDDMGFMILMASPGNTMEAVLEEQNRAIFLGKGLSDSLVERRIAFMREAYHVADSMCRLGDTTNLVKRMTMELRKTKDANTVGLTKEEKQSVGLTNGECFAWAMLLTQHYLRAVLRLDPAEFLSLQRCPVLALNGSRDVQVLAESNLSRMAEFAKIGGVAFTAKICDGKNHLFQDSATGMPDEYARLGQSPAPDVLAEMIKWLEEISVVNR